MSGELEEGKYFRILSFGRLLASRSMNPIDVCSADNGGPGTYSQLLIMGEYMARIAHDEGVEPQCVYPADYFDLIGGVGFGGCVIGTSLHLHSYLGSLAALMLGHLRMNVDQAIKELIAVGCAVFPLNAPRNQEPRENMGALREAIKGLLRSQDLPLDLMMDDERRPSPMCKVCVLHGHESFK